MKTKICSKCKKELEITEFHKNKLLKDGLCYWCKKCLSDYRKTFKKYCREYRNNHREKIRKIQNKYFISSGGIYHSIKGSAKKRNINFNVTKEEFIIWYNNQEKICYYCGLTFEKSKSIDYLENKSRRLSVDRKDNNKGYELNNIVLACRRCNNIKSNYFTEEEMLEVGKIINKKEKLEVTK